MTRLGTVLGAAVNMQQRPGGATETDADVARGMSVRRHRRCAAACVGHAQDPRALDRSAVQHVIRQPGAAVRARQWRGRRRRLSARDDVDASVCRRSPTHARDFIERPSALPFENQDRYRFRGAELTMQTARDSATGSARRLQLSSTRSDVTDGVTRPLQTRPRHRGSLEWVWTPMSASAVRGAVLSDTARSSSTRAAAIRCRCAPTATRSSTSDSRRRLARAASIWRST